MEQATYDAFVKFRNCYKFEQTDEFDMDKLHELVEQWDSHETPFKHTARLALGDRSSLPYIMGRASAIVVGSTYVTQDPAKQREWDIDLGYKLMYLALECEQNNMSVCITTNFDKERAREACKCQHSMDYDCKAALIVGREKKGGGILERLYSWFNSDNYRVPYDRFVKGLGSVRNPKLVSVFEGMQQAFSFGNAQNWRITATETKIHFFASSDLDERFINIGFAIAAFEIVSEHVGIQGYWKFDSAAAAGETGYCVSFVIGKPRRKA